ncbi:MAG: tagatose-bisphosphate aldolase, partial [Bacillales bacterium]|nr:tagatose-bisphosphate aldolase [Bacillales bacterium]
TGYWDNHYFGSEECVRIERKYSFSDRCRYYLPTNVVNCAFNKLMENLNSVEIPLTLISQYMNSQYKEIRNHQLELSPENLLKSKIGEVLDDYMYATGEF